MIITKKQIDEEVKRYLNRSEKQIELVEKRIRKQMEDTRAMIKEYNSTLLNLQKELTIHLIAKDTVKNS